MRLWMKLVACFLFVSATYAGGAAVAAQDEGTAETIDVSAAVYACEDADCSGETAPLGGVTVTSFTADGTELDSCTTEEGSGQCALTIPAAEDGTYALVPPSGYETYELVNEAPEAVGELDAAGRQWLFAPTGEAEGDDTAADAEVDGEATAEAAADDTATGEGDGETEASSLPSTGSGPLAITPASTVPFAIGAVLAMIVAAVVLRARRI